MTFAEVAIAWLDIAASIVLVGGLAFAALVEVPDGRGRRFLPWAACFLAAALLLEVLGNTLRMHEISGLGGEALLVDVLEMRWTRWWIVRVLVLTAIAAGLAAPRPPWRSLAVIGVASLALRSLQGHAGAHGVEATLADWLHFCSASVWVGGLFQLALCSTVSSSVALRVKRTFTLVLGPLVLSGVYGALLHVASVTLLVTSPYGRVLLAKVATAAVVLGLGAMNHYRHVPAVRGGEIDAGRRLVSTVRAEIVVAALVLLLTALLGTLSMPHATSP